MSELPETKAVNLTLNDEWLTISFNQPEKRNALTEELTSDIKNVLGSIKEDMSIRGVSMKGEGGIFCAGGDLKSFKSGFQGGEQALEDVYSASAMTGEFFDMINSFPKPIIIACNGHAIAKGAFLLLSADYRIGVEGDFKIGLNEVMIGMTMHNAGIAIAKSRLSKVYLNRSVNNAEIFTSKEAIHAGFLDKIVPKEYLLPTAIKVAEMSAKLNKKAHAETKLRVRKTHLETLEKAIELDLQESISLN